MNRTLLGFGLLTFAGACLSAEMPSAISDMGCTNCHTLLDILPALSRWLPLTRKGWGFLLPALDVPSGECSVRH